MKNHLENLAAKQALLIQESYDRVRKTIKNKKVTVKPILPPDILSILILLPQLE